MSYYTKTDRDTAYRLLRRDMPRDAIADVIGCRRRTITRWAAAIGIDLRRGRGGAIRQISEKTEIRIVKLRAKKHSLRSIGKIIGWSQTTVMRVLRRKGIP